VKIAIIIDGQGGELDRETRAIPANASDEFIDETIQRVIENWNLSVGDTIRIVEIGA
jgi:hypothetical protein